MSALAYVPRFDGVLFDGRALPGRNPIDGQFHSSGPGLYAVDHDDELLNDCNPIDMQLVTNLDLGEEPEEEEEDDVHMFEPDVRPFDKHEELAERHHCNPRYGDEEGNHFASMAIEAGLDPREDVYVWNKEDQAAIIEAWVQERYGFNERNLAVDDFGVYGEYEHLPYHIGRIASFRSHPGYSGSWSPEEWRGFYQSHGKRGRLNGVKLQKHRHIRKRRQQTDRQMNYEWLVEMTSDHDNFGRMTPEAFLEGFLDFVEIEEELRFLDEREQELNHRFWRDHVSTDPITEAGQNCHGFGDRDPLEEDLYPEPEYRFDPVLGRFRYFYGGDYYFGDDYDYPADEWGTYDDPMDRYEFGFFTEEDFDRFDAEAVAEEAEAEALEFAFEHLVGGNAIGRRAQLAAASSRV